MGLYTRSAVAEGARCGGRVSSAPLSSIAGILFKWHFRRAIPATLIAVQDSTSLTLLDRNTAFSTNSAMS